MDVALVTQRISLRPDVAGEVLLDVVNTGDVIDALQVELAGIPGAVVHLDAVPALFPGERRRLPLRVRLPRRCRPGGTSWKCGSRRRPASSAGRPS